MEEEAGLRERVRERLQEEKLPLREPDRIWGGPGVNAPCAVCERPVVHGEMEFEVQFARDGAVDRHFDVYHVHVRCFAVWELVRKERAR
jgi:hypothetical protein